MSGINVTVITLDDAVNLLPAVLSALTDLNVNVYTDEYKIQYPALTSSDLANDALFALSSLKSPSASAFLVLANGNHLNLEPCLMALKTIAPSAMRMVVASAPASEISDGLLAAWIQSGATDFVLAPFCDAELKTRLLRGMTKPSEPGPEKHQHANMPAAFKHLLGNSQRFQKELHKLLPIAACDAGVLLLGETGTGKEVCAQAIHYASKRSHGPWVAVNCGAIPVDLMEDELFGHVRGAYTHAHNNREGLIREAEGGTLFLDEIDALPLNAQSKLLRFLQDKEYRPVGSNAIVKANVRVITASNQCLNDAVKQGRFREDLYFRLNVLNLTLPTLRDRLEDIPQLAQHFANLAAHSIGQEACSLKQTVFERLSQYHWPGNVRELKHLIERTVLMNGGANIEAEQLELPNGAVVDKPFCDSLRSAKAKMVEHFERSYLQQLLSNCQGNISHAARLAKKNRRSLFELLRKHDIDAQQYRETSMN